jgi:cyclic pyranopterin phosphate synthase
MPASPPDSAPTRLTLSTRDQLSRKLRLSVVDYCNLRCFFCHNEGQGALTRQRTDLSVHDISLLVSGAVLAGVREVKLTGGEPLLYRHGRAGIADAVRAIRAEAGHLFGLSVTTNGTLLQRSAEQLRVAGLDRVTVSLHTLDAAQARASIRSHMTLESINGILAGLREAQQAGLTPLKVNTVIFGPGAGGPGNLAELPRLLDVCREAGVSELRLYPVLSHSGFQGIAFAERHVPWDVTTFGAIAEHLAPPGDSSRLAATLTQFVSDWAPVLYPKASLEIVLDGLTVCVEPMRDGRFMEDGLPTEGPYALRVSARGELRGLLGSGPMVPLLEQLRAAYEPSHLAVTFAQARKALLPLPAMRETAMPDQAAEGFVAPR